MKILEKWCCVLIATYQVTHDFNLPIFNDFHFHHLKVGSARCHCYKVTHLLYNLKVLVGSSFSLWKYSIFHQTFDLFTYTSVFRFMARFYSIKLIFILWSFNVTIYFVQSFSILAMEAPAKSLLCPFDMFLLFFEGFCMCVVFSWGGEGCWLFFNFPNPALKSAIFPKNSWILLVENGI